jgi:hypothetical protein
LQIPEAEIRVLTNLPNSMNASPSIVEGVRTQTDARFAVVSGVVDGDYLLLLATYDADAINTVSVGTSTVHISYSCQVVEEVLHEVWATGSLIPIVIYLTPIRYDPKTSRVVVDLDSADGTQQK